MSSQCLAHAFFIYAARMNDPPVAGCCRDREPGNEGTVPSLGTPPPRRRGRRREEGLLTVSGRASKE